MPIIDADAQDRADMKRLADGESAALNNLMERHAAAVFGFLVRLLGNEEDANDLAQETFVRVYRGGHGFRGASKFSTWLYTIAGNLARNHHRWRGRHPTLALDAELGSPEQRLSEVLPAPGLAPDASAVAAERAAAVRGVVDRLPEDLRAAVVLCEWEELTVADAAQVLATTPKAVEARLYRARKILRERLVNLL